MLSIDGYTDVERIGHGGLGDVYRATRVSTGGTVAIKVLRDVSDESIAWNRTRRELTALVSLGGHAHVIRLLELLEDMPGLVMEYAPGGSVAQLLDTHGGTLSVGEIALIGRQTASALAAAHDQGIVHRDVKPQNLLIDAYGQVKLCDFGIASLARTEEFRTRTSAISMRYASPEDLEDAGDIGPAADVYSLGATLLHLAHGAPPTLKERLAPWTPPETDDTELAALDRVLAECLHPTPSARPSAHDVQERLEALEWDLSERCRALAPAAPEVSAGEAPSPAPDPVAHDSGSRTATPAPDDQVDDETVYRTGRRPPAPPPRPVATTRRHRWVPVALGALVVAAVVVGWQLVDRDAAVAPTTTADPDAVATTSTTAPTTTAPATTGDRLVVVERPSGLTPLDDPTITWPFGAVGECLVQVVGDDTLRTVGCDEPHDLQRVASGELAADTTPAGEPDESMLASVVADRCEVDVRLIDTEIGLRLAQTHPSAASWTSGDRRYQCLVGVPGSRLVGSAVG